MSDDPASEPRLDALERLAALYEKGLLTREEFDAQKAQILAGVAPATEATRVEAPVAQPVPPGVHPIDETIQPPSSRPSTATLVLGGSAAVAVIALGAVFWMLWSRSPPTGPSAVTNAMSATTAATAADTVALPPPPSLDDAFALAFGGKGAVVKTVTWQHYPVRVRYTPQKLIPIQGGYAVIAKGDVVDPAHVNSGFLGVAYLSAGTSDWAVTGQWPQLVDTGSFGEIEGWKPRDDLFDNPGLEVRGGYMGQGCGVDSADLVELTPGAPTVRAHVLASFDYPKPDDDADAPPPDSSDPNAAPIQYGHTQAKIVSQVKGHSFQAIYDGDYPRTVTYSGPSPGLFRPSANAKSLPAC
jgi:hypothetical protein